MPTTIRTTGPTGERGAHAASGGVPAAGRYRELLNSDAGLYGGSNTGNSGGVHTEASPCHGHPYSLSLTLPPLSFLFFKLHTD